MVRALRPLLGACAALLLVTTPGAAQVGSTAQITGTVRDTSGAVLPGADVTASRPTPASAARPSPMPTDSSCSPTCPSVPTASRPCSPASVPTSRPASCCRSTPTPRSTSRCSLGRGHRDGGGAGGDAARRNAQSRHRPGDRERAHRGAAAERPQPGRPHHAGGRRRAAAGARRHEPQHAGRQALLPWPEGRASASPTCSTGRRTTIRTTT